MYFEREWLVGGEAFIMDRKFLVLVSLFLESKLMRIREVRG